MPGLTSYQEDTQRGEDEGCDELDDVAASHGHGASLVAASWEGAIRDARRRDLTGSRDCRDDKRWYTVYSLPVLELPKPVACTIVWPILASMTNPKLLYGSGFLTTAIFLLSILCASY